MRSSITDHVVLVSLCVLTLLDGFLALRGNLGAAVLAPLAFWLLLKQSDKMQAKHQPHHPGYVRH